jgi:glutamine amidotransferase/cyclase/glutamine amidotransferase
MKLGVLDYGGGNLRSVLNAFDAIGAHANLVTKPEDFNAIDVLVFPGQGAFGDSIRILKETGLWEPLQAWLKAEKPYLGICLGYQILFDESDEAPGVAGLGVVPGAVRRFEDEPGLKIPHMGWNSAVSKRGETRIWKGLGAEPYFYYVHSYFPSPEDPRVVVAETTYGTQTFAGAVEQGNLFACQFHPEKSQDAGIRLIRNFLGM